jgi:hypothetical protein
MTPLSCVAATLAETESPATEAGSQGMVLPGFEWSLPCETKLNSQGQRLPNSGTRLTGSVTQWNIDGDFGQLFANLLDSAVGGHPDAARLDKALAHYSKTSSQFLSNCKDAVNFMTPYRGFGPSSQAADVILDEKVKVTDKGSAEYARQRLVDDVHPQLVTKVLQLALAAGTSDPVEHDELVHNAMNSLSGMVGQERAQATLDRLEEWKKLNIPKGAYATVAHYDVETFDAKVKQITKLAMDGDPAMKQIEKSLHKYNHINPLSRAASHPIEGALCVAEFAAPGYFIPAIIQAIDLGYVMATGGPEEKKLIKELYYDRRVESRYRTINAEAQMAMAQYQNAANQQNPVLMVCCESVISQLVGTENVQDVLGRTVLAHQSGQKQMTASSDDQKLQ